VTTRRRTARRPTTAAMPPRLTWRAFESGPFTLSGGTNQGFDLGVEGLGPTLVALGIVGDYTIRRVRWRLAVNNADAEDAVNTANMLFAGMVVVSADAFASGVGALPNPISDASPWWAYHTLPYFVGGTLTGRNEAYQHYELDERSMRKVNENSQVPALVFALITGGTANVTFAGRILVSHGRR